MEKKKSVESKLPGDLLISMPDILIATDYTSC